MPAQIRPTGIGLIDALLNSIYRDPFGGLSTVLGLPSAVNRFAAGIRPGIFQHMAQSPIDFHILGDQPFTRGSLLGQSSILKEIDRAIGGEFGEDIARFTSERAGPEFRSLLSGLRAAPGGIPERAAGLQMAEKYGHPLEPFVAGHETAHIVQKLHNLAAGRIPPGSVSSGFLPLRVQQRLLEQFRPRVSVGGGPKEEAIQILGEIYSGQRPLPR